MVCKDCKEEKQRVPEVRGSAVRFFTDGKMWNGKQCPDCYKKSNKLRMRKSRSDQKGTSSSSSEREDSTIKSCSSSSKE